MPTIRDLIRESLAAGKSVRDLEADSGYLVKFQTFQELSNSAPKQFPKKAETVTGMASALRVTESAVVLAYARGLGIPVTARSEFALRLPAGVDDIDGPMQRALISVVRAAIAQGEQDADEPGDPTGTTSIPRTPPPSPRPESEKTPDNVVDLIPPDQASPKRRAARTRPKGFDPEDPDGRT